VDRARVVVEHEAVYEAGLAQQAGGLQARDELAHGDVVRRPGVQQLVRRVRVTLERPAQPPYIYSFLFIYFCLQRFDRCWSGGRKGIRPVKTEWWSAGMVVCLEQGADLHMAQLMPLPHTVSCFSKIQIGFWYTGSPG